MLKRRRVAAPHVPVEQLKILVKIRPPRRAIDSLPDDEDVSSEYPSEDEPLQRTRSKTKKCGPPVGKTKEVVLDAEGISQISESSYKSATTSTDTQDMDDQEMELVMGRSTSKKQDNANSMLIFFGRSKFNSPRINTEKRNVVLTVPSLNQKKPLWCKN